MTAEMFTKKQNALEALKNEVETRNSESKRAFYEQTPAAIISHKLEVFTAKFDEETQRAEIVTTYRYADITRAAKKTGADGTIKAEIKKLENLTREHTAKEYTDGKGVSNTKIVDILQNIFNVFNLETLDSKGERVKAKATAAHARYIKNGMTRNTREAGETAASGAKNQVAMLIYAVANNIDLRVKQPKTNGGTTAPAPAEDTKPTPTETAPATEAATAPEATPAAETVTPAETTPAPAAETPAETPKKSKKSA